MRDLFGRGYKYDKVIIDKTFPDYIFNNQNKNDFSSRNEFIQPINKFIQSRNRFIQPRNKFIQSRNKFIQSELTVRIDQQ